MVRTISMAPDQLPNERILRHGWGSEPALRYTVVYLRFVLSQRIGLGEYSIVQMLILVI